MKSQEREKQLQELDEWIKTNLDSRELKRALGVKLALQGWAYRAIAEVLNVSKSFISKWKKCYEESGIEGLKLSYQGAESYLTSQQRQETCHLFDPVVAACKHNRSASQTSRFSA